MYLYFRCQTQTREVPTVQQTLSLDSQSSHPPPFLLNSSAHRSIDCHLYAEVSPPNTLLGAVHPTSFCSNYIHRGWHAVSPKKTSERRLQDKPLTSTLRFHSVSPQSLFSCPPTVKMNKSISSM